MGYWTLSGLDNLYLEDTWILSVRADESTLTFEAPPSKSPRRTNLKNSSDAMCGMCHRKRRNVRDRAHRRPASAGPPSSCRTILDPAHRRPAAMRRVQTRFHSEISTCHYRGMSRDATATELPGCFVVEGARDRPGHSSGSRTIDRRRAVRRAYTSTPNGI